jgi:hypothetical protein
MSILQIDGFTEHTGDWKLAGVLRLSSFDVVERECAADNSTNSASLEDVQASDSDAVYSWGWRTILHLQCTKQKRLFFGVLCVDDPLFPVRFPGPTNYSKVVIVQIDEAFPKSAAAQGDYWVDILDPELHRKISDGPRVVNISARSLWPVVQDGITMHTKTQNRREVLELGAWCFLTFAREGI